MTGRRRVSVLAAVLLAPVLLLAGGALVLRGDAGTTDGVAASMPAEPGAVVQQLDAGADPATGIEALQDRLRRLPTDDQAWATLGFAYVEQARRTADPSFYHLSDQALDRSLTLRPDANADALTGKAALANARHDFPTGRDLALQAAVADPFDATAKGVLVDALVELGEYEAAEAAIEDMLALRPGVPSFSRASYLFELRGDTDRASDALERALRVSTGAGDASFALFHLGELAFGSGDLEAAAVHYDEGLRRSPSSAALLAGRAKVKAARGDVDAALADYADVVQRLPQPSYLVEYGELLDSEDRHEEAARQYAVADAAQALLASAGSVPDVETVLYDADHGRPEQALGNAEALYAARRSVHVEDAMAWALHAVGRDAEALEHAVAAQRLGTRNALWDYHRGMIQLALGRSDEGRASLALALGTNPYFSALHAPVARSAVAATQTG